MRKQNIAIIFTVEKGILIPLNDVEKLKHKQFIEKHKDGTIVECYYSVNIDSRRASLSQLAKVHALIKELSVYTGYNSVEMKKIIKENAGLYFNEDLKSFADCSKAELNEAIEACIQLGNEIGCNIY